MFNLLLAVLMSNDNKGAKIASKVIIALAVIWSIFLTVLGCQVVIRVCFGGARQTEIMGQCFKTSAIVTAIAVVTVFLIFMISKAAKKKAKK